AELGVVTEDRALDVAVLGAVDQHHALGGLDLTPVEREGDRLDLGAWHQAATSAGASIGFGPAPAPRLTCGMAAPKPASSRLAAMYGSNSRPKCLIMEPMGIAIASPSTHRQLPMICSHTEAMMSRS